MKKNSPLYNKIIYWWKRLVKKAKMSECNYTLNQSEIAKLANTSQGSVSKAITLFYEKE